MIAYPFPPRGGGGVQRTLGFVEHLPAHGFRPIVITGPVDDGYWATDPTLVDRVPAQCEVVRVTGGRWLSASRQLRRIVPAAVRARVDRALFVPDLEAPWGRAAVRAALARAGESRVIYSTSSPWTDHLVAARVAAKTGLPWVSDFRDPWTQNHTFVAASGLHRRVHRALEGRVYARSSRIVLNTEMNQRAVVGEFAEARGKALTIRNGYDEADFVGLPAPPTEGPVRLGYAGSFYAGYGPQALLTLLASAQRHCGAPGFETVFMGPAPVAPLAGEAGVRGVRDVGYLPQRATLEALARCHAVIVVLPESSTPLGWVPQKVYVYLRLGRPILAVVPPGEARDLIAGSGGPHLIIDPRDVGKAGARVADWLKRRPAGVDPLPYAAQFDRRVHTARLAEVFSSLVDGG